VPSPAVVSTAASPAGAIERGASTGVATEPSPGTADRTRVTAVGSPPSTPADGRFGTRVVGSPTTSSGPVGQATGGGEATGRVATGAARSTRDVVTETVGARGLVTLSPHGSRRGGAPVAVAAPGPSEQIRTGPITKRRRTVRPDTVATPVPDGATGRSFVPWTEPPARTVAGTAGRPTRRGVQPETVVDPAAAVRAVRPTRTDATRTRGTATTHAPSAPGPTRQSGAAGHAGTRGTTGNAGRHRPTSTTTTAGPVGRAAEAGSTRHTGTVGRTRTAPTTRATTEARTGGRSRPAATSGSATEAGTARTAGSAGGPGNVRSRAAPAARRAGTFPTRAGRLVGNDRPAGARNLRAAGP